MIKRTVALIIAVLMCFGAVSCGKDSDAPEGMHLVSLEGEPFKLYVPEAWTNNSSSGISGAYYSALSNITVSARYHSHANAAITLEEYAHECAEGYAASLKLFVLAEKNAAVLGGNNAIELKYTADYNGTNFTVRQLITAHGGDGEFVLLSFYCPTELFEENSVQFNEIAEAFVLCEKQADVGDCVTDKKTPEGMKIASSDKIEYRLYVPNSWICNSQSGKSEAYYPESGKPNVTVTSYSPDDAMTAEQYFAMCETQYKETLSGYEFISKTDRTVAERSAISYKYRVNYGGQSIVLLQTVLVYNEIVYSITYTALEDRFDVYMGDVQTILDSFIFR